MRIYGDSFLKINTADMAHFWLPLQSTNYQSQVNLNYFRTKYVKIIFADFYSAEFNLLFGMFPATS